MFEIIKNINPLMILVFVTFFVGLFFLDLKKNNHKLLFYVLLVCFITEVLSIYNLIIKNNINFLYSISLLFYFVLWLLILKSTTKFHKTSILFIFLFILFGIINLFYFEGIKSFNFSTFIVGAFFYNLIVIVSSIYFIKNELLNFYKSNEFLLIIAPILFMFGLSFMFGFKSIDLTNTFVFKKLKLYTFVTYSVNLVNYTLINIYIYRERKLKNA